MEHIIIRHLTGAKAHHVEAFSLHDFQELTFGRNTSAMIQFDLTSDDLVSREHAKIARDTHDENRFILTDLGSKNGTYVNKTRISGPTRLTPGAVIQFGVGGPEVQFDLDPPPQAMAPPTRIAQLTSGDLRADILPPLTRIGDAGITQTSSSISGGTPPSVGLQTVQRLIGDSLAQSQSGTQKTFMKWAAAVLGVLVIVAGVFVYKLRQTQEQLWATGTQLQATRKLAEVTQQEMSKAQKTQKAQAGKMSEAQIAEKYGPATVHIAVSWKLVSAETGGQVYHRYIKKTNKKSKKEPDKEPAYVLIDEKIEPWLVLDDENGKNEPIVDTGSGSGFVVTEQGFILTSRHVAAPWLAQQFSKFPGELYDFETKKFIKSLKGYEKDLKKWIPAKSQQLGGRDPEVTRLEGKHTYMYVTFPHSTVRISATLERVSIEHDVAMIKIETPASVPKVDPEDTFAPAQSGNTAQPGEHVTVLGYPSISLNELAITPSQDLFHRLTHVVEKRDPTVTPGVIGKILGREKEKEDSRERSYAPMVGFQLTVNAAGAGNSGGPVFDERGKAIAIFYARKKDEDGTRVTFAVPIKFGMALLEPWR